MKIMISILIIICISMQVSSKTIHTIIFADTNDSSIGEGVKVNVTKITEWSKMIATAFKTEGYNEKIYTYSGNQCNKANLISFINNLNCSGDIVIFFYGGHGGRSVNDTSKFPRICLGSNNESQFVKLSYLNDMLKQKSPQLQIIIADCCNSYYNGNIPQSRTMPMGNETHTMSYSPIKIKELFLNKTGSIVCTGATKGEYGWINSLSGGFFTYSFLESFNFSLNREGETPSWNTILTDTRDQTFEISQKAYLARRITKSQTPVFDISLEEETDKKKEILTRINFGNGYYLGQAVDNKKQGIGAYYFNNGQRFEGEFVNDEINGSGIYFWSDNHYFAGTWMNGKRTGYGIEVRPDGSFTCQYWENEKMIGHPIIHNAQRLNYSNGYYIGEVSNGVANGKGKYYWNDGSKFEGTWINGVIDGSGLLTFSNNMGYYVGYWRNGKRLACYGLQCLNNGNRLIGYWENEIYRAKSFIIYKQ